MVGPVQHPGPLERACERSSGHRLFEVVGIVAAVTSALWLMWRCLEGIDLVAQTEGRDAGRRHGLIFAAALAAGYVVADFFSGVVHFTFDRFFSVDTPVIGRNFVQPFREHHQDPKEMTRHGFVETNGNNCLATCPVLFAVIAVPFDPTVGWQLFVVAVIVSGAVGEFMTNQIHKWSHADDPPPIVRWLQERRLILPRRHHQLHHTWPYDAHYCITTGWCNAILGRLGFWQGLEWFYTRVLRLRLYTEPTPWEQVPGSPAFREREHMATTNGL